VTFNIARRHQFIITQPVVIFFSAAYFAAASLTMGAITESSAVIADIDPIKVARKLWKHTRNIHSLFCFAGFPVQGKQGIAA